MKTPSKNFPSTSIASDPATGANYTSTYDLFTVGAGYLDVRAGLDKTDMATGPALSAISYYHISTGETSVVTGPDSVWQKVVVRGTAVVWGSKIVNGTIAVWGASIDCGMNVHGSFAVVWGAAVVWGSNQRFPEAVSIQGDR